MHSVEQNVGISDQLYFRHSARFLLFLLLLARRRLYPMSKDVNVKNEKTQCKQQFSSAEMAAEIEHKTDSAFVGTAKGKRNRTNPTHAPHGRGATVMAHAMASRWTQS